MSAKSNDPWLKFEIVINGIPDSALGGGWWSPSAIDNDIVLRLEYAHPTGRLRYSVAPTGLISASIFAETGASSDSFRRKVIADLTSAFLRLQSAVRRPEQAAARTDWRKRLRVAGIFSSRSLQASTFARSFSSLATMRRCSFSGGIVALSVLSRLTLKAWLSGC